VIFTEFVNSVTVKKVSVNDQAFALKIVENLQNLAGLADFGTEVDIAYDESMTADHGGYYTIHKNHLYGGFWISASRPIFGSKREAKGPK
jgi:hypothetical protein